MKNLLQKPPDNGSHIPRSPPPDFNATERKVHIGYRPVGGRAAAWTIGLIYSFFKDKKNAKGQERLPDPHYHWCVLVGEYHHQMQITDGMVWYDNHRTSWKDGWSVFDVGVTKFNDAAIADTAAKTLLGMPGEYDLWTNNCHHFVLKLLDHICMTDDHRQKLVEPYRRRHRQSISSVKPDRLFSEGGPLYNHVVSNMNMKPKAAKAVMDRAENIMAQHTPRVTPDELKAGSQDDLRQA